MALNKMRSKPSQGFTLIELLISIALLTAVIFISSLSFSVFSRLWQNEESHFHDLERTQRNVLAAQISLRHMANYLSENSRGELEYFFVGERDAFRYVTNSPVFSSRHQAIAEFRIIRDSQQLEPDRVIYRETPFNETNMLRIPETIEFERELLIFESENIRFNYYAWEGRLQLNQFYEDRSTGPVWSDSYSAAVTRLMPLAVSILMGANEPIVFSLPSDLGVLYLFSRTEVSDGA